MFSSLVLPNCVSRISPPPSRLPGGKIHQKLGMGDDSGLTASVLLNKVARGGGRGFHRMHIPKLLEGYILKYLCSESGVAEPDPQGSASNGKAESRSK